MSPFFCLIVLGMLIVVIIAAFLPVSLLLLWADLFQIGLARGILSWEIMTSTAWEGPVDWRPLVTTAIWYERGKIAICSRP